MTQDPDNVPPGRVYTMRDPITLIRNGKLLTGYIQTSIQVWKVIVTGILGLAIFIGATATIGGAILEPPIKAIVEESIAEVKGIIVSHQVDQAAHLGVLADRFREEEVKYVKRDELNDLLAVRQKQIDQMASQIEFLYQNEIKKNRRSQ